MCRNCVQVSAIGRRRLARQPMSGCRQGNVRQPATRCTPAHTPGSACRRRAMRHQAWRDAILGKLTVPAHKGTITCWHGRVHLRAGTQKMRAGWGAHAGWQVLLAQRRPCACRQDDPVCRHTQCWLPACGAAVAGTDRSACRHGLSWLPARWSGLPAGVVPVAGRRCRGCRDRQVCLPAWAVMVAGKTARFARMRCAGCRHAVLGLPGQTGLLAGMGGSDCREGRQRLPAHAAGYAHPGHVNGGTCRQMCPHPCRFKTNS